VPTVAGPPPAFEINRPDIVGLAGITQPSDRRVPAWPAAALGLGPTQTACQPGYGCQAGKLIRTVVASGNSGVEFLGSPAFMFLMKLYERNDDIAA